MRKSLFFLSLSFLFVSGIEAGEPRLANYYHPASEARGLYIVDFSYNGRHKSYRMYCPTGMVRDISDGAWKKARKAYVEDRVNYGSRMVVRNIFDRVCASGSVQQARPVASRPVLADYYHPKSEPPRLYIADFDYAGVHKTYRVYCPTGMVRDISDGAWKKARKAYVEDRVNYGNIRVVREIFDEVCR